MIDQNDSRPARDESPDRDAWTLYCLLASYEAYGVSHGWPACLVGTHVVGERS